jgi:quinol monooxygenase YgiN
MELRIAAMTTGDCLLFSVFYNAERLELFVQQSWRTMAALEAFTSSSSFERFTTHWTGLLCAPAQHQQFAEQVL